MRKLLTFILIASQVLTPNLSLANGTEVNPDPLATDSGHDPATCEYLFSSLRDTNLSEEQKKLIVEYLKNPENYKISGKQKLMAMLRADTLAPGAIFRVVYRNVKNKETGENKKQTVVIMGQPSSLSKKQAEDAFMLKDAMGNTALSGESKEVRRERERESLNSDEVKFLTLVRKYISSFFAKSYRSIRIWPNRLWTLARGRKKPLQHSIRQDRDLRKSAYYMEDGYQPLIEETADVVGGDVRTFLYLSDMWLFALEIKSFLLNGSDYFEPSLGGLLSIFNDPTMLTIASVLGVNFLSALIMNKYDLLQNYPGKIFRAFWGYEKNENDSALFSRKGFMANSISFITMKLYNKKIKDFEPLLVVVDKAKVESITAELLSKGLPIDPPADDSSSEKERFRRNGDAEKPTNSSLWETSQFKEVQLRL